MTPTAPSPEVTMELLAGELCDRCGFKAVSLVELPSHSFLTLCGHHTRNYQKALLAAGATVFTPEEEAAPVPS